MKKLLLVLVLGLAACGAPVKQQTIWDSGGITVGPRNPDAFANPTGTPGESATVITHGKDPRFEKSIKPLEWTSATYYGSWPLTQDQVYGVNRSCVPPRIEWPQ